MNPPELRASVIAEWATGKFASEIALELGLTESRAHRIIKYGADAETNREHYQNKAQREIKRYISPENLSREARVLRDWADGWSATDIAIRFGGGMTRNIPIGIVNRSRGEFAEEAKRTHAAAAKIRYGRLMQWRPKRALPEPAQRNRIVSVDAIVAKREPRRFAATDGLVKELKQRQKAEQKAATGPVRRDRLHDLSPQALAERREKQAAAGRAAIAKVELTRIANPAFVAKVEKPADLYAHMRTERGYHDAIAALSR